MDDAWTVAASLAPLTKKMKLVPPTLGPRLLLAIG
jgi:hypothetical protein